MCFPTGGVAQGQHIERMKGDDGIKAVVIAPSGMNGLRTAHFFGRLTHETEGTSNSVCLHCRLGGEDAGKGADA
jgi:hypothetical protein